MTDTIDTKISQHFLNLPLVLPESATLKGSAEAKLIIAKGVDLVNLTAGEPHFAPPAMFDLAKLPAGYSPAPGMPRLLELYAQSFNELVRGAENGLQITPANITVTNGGKGALHFATMTAVPRGTAIITAAPYWLSYKALAEANGCKIIGVPTSEDNGYLMTAAQLDIALRDNPNASTFLLTTPSNPTGSAANADQLCAYADILDRYPHITIMQDIIYAYWHHEGEHENILTVRPDMFHRTITTDSTAKSMASPGLRTGFVVAPENLIAAIRGNQSHLSGNPNNAGQMAAIAVLESDQSYRSVWRDTFRKNAYALADAMGARRPDGAFYAYGNFEDLKGLQVTADLPVFEGMEKLGYKSLAGRVITSAADVADIMKVHFGMAVVPANDFGDPWGVRLSAAISEETLKKTLERLSAFNRSFRPSIEGR